MQIYKEGEPFGGGTSESRIRHVCSKESNPPKFEFTRHQAGRHQIFEFVMTSKYACPQ